MRCSACKNRFRLRQKIEPLIWETGITTAIRIITNPRGSEYLTPGRVIFFKDNHER